MVISEANSNIINTAAKKRRLRRKRLIAARATNENKNYSGDSRATSGLNGNNNPETELSTKTTDRLSQVNINSGVLVQSKLKMSSNEAKKSRDDVLAAREAKKLAKQKGKSKGPVHNEVKEGPKKEKDVPVTSFDKENKSGSKAEVSPQKSKDEVDRAIISENVISRGGESSKDVIKAERAAKKAAKQAKKKKDEGEAGEAKKDSEITVKDVVETLRDIVNVAKEVQDVTAKVQAISLEPKRAGETSTKKPEIEGTPQTEEGGKSKAELRAERRAKQEAQRAAKQASVQQKVAPAPEAKATVEEPGKAKEERPAKAKSVEKSKPKQQNVTRVNWFQHLHMQQDKEALKKIPVNSANLHPAIVKLGVQMASRVVSGSNARCIALLDALKKMVRDYTLPAKTEFARGLEAHLATSLDFLWSMRQPSASQTNAVKFFRHHVTQLPNNVGEFDAKKTLQEEIDRYIREQIDMAGEAISLTVRNKISNGDNILTYGCSSLVERILREAWAAGLQFRAVVVGARVGAPGARALLRRLARAGLPAAYVDITAVSFVMSTINKVLLGASSLLVNGSVLGAAGTAQVALVARACNVPVLVACETHKFSERVQTDAFVYNEIGDPDELVDKTDPNSPLKDWRSNPNLTPLNLTYDVTPPSLVTAVVTELAILPCTSAPVVLRFKLSEYGMQG